jgi:glycosyltransferase involved in cell wall biosynthesis
VHADLSFSYSPPIAAIISAVWLAIWRKAFDVVVVLSDFSFRYYASYISSTKLQRVYNGRDLCREGIAVGIAEAERLVVGEWRKRGMTIIGSCAVLTPVKGLEQVLTFLAQNQDYAYVIVGDGPALSDLKYMADRLGIVDRVLFTGRKKDVSPYLQLMDLFALPSRSEGLPLAALEAASVGLPILCSDIEIFREIFDSESAAFFPLDDIAALGVAAESMLDRLYEMGSKARARYLNFFTLKKMAEGYLAVYSNKP